MSLLQSTRNRNHLASLPRPFHPMPKKNKRKNQILQNIQFHLDSFGLDQPSTNTIQHCLFSFLHSTTIDYTAIHPKHHKFVHLQNTIGWRHFIRGRIAHNSTECFNIKPSHNQNKYTSIPSIICTTMLKTHIETWCKYSNERSSQKYDLTQVTATLKNFHQQSLHYSFPPRIQKWFSATHTQLSTLSENEISHRLQHAQLLLKNARSLNLRLNKITNYFAPSNTSDHITPHNTITCQPHTRISSNTSTSSNQNPSLPINNKELLTFLPYNYVRGTQRTKHLNQKSVNNIRIRRNKYKKFSIIRPTYTTNPQNTPKYTIPRHNINNPSRKRTRDIQISDDRKDTRYKLRKYNTNPDSFLTYKYKPRKRNTYVEPVHRKTKKQKVDIPTHV